MSATPVPPNPCCAALQLRCSKLEEKRNALRQGCLILKDQLKRLEADNGGLKKVYDEERARADHERNLKEKERQCLEKELMIVQEQVSEKGAEIDRLKQLLEEETRKATVERENVKMERHKGMELNDSFSRERQCSERELMIVQEQVSEKAAEIDRLKQLLGEETRKAKVERENVKMERHKGMELNESFSKERQCLEKELMIVQEQVSEKAAEIDMLKHLLEEETRKAKVERENVKMERHKGMELNDSLEAQKTRAKETCTCDVKTVGDLESYKAKLLQYDKLADENERKLVEERSYSNNLLKQCQEQTVRVEQLQKEVLEAKSSCASAEASLAMQLSDNETELNHLRNLLEVEKSRADAEQKKTAMLQETLELEKSKSLESSIVTQAEANKAKESLLIIERLKNEVSELTLGQSKFKDMTMKYQAEKKKVLRERQRADAAKVKSVELKNLAEDNEKKIMEEKLNSEQLLQQVKEERQNVETLQKQVQELLADKSNANAHSDFLELKEAYSKLVTENRSLVKEKNHTERVRAQELERLTEKNEKKVMEERFNSKQLAQQMEAERQKIDMLQKQLEVLLSSAKSTSSGHSDYLKLKEAYSKLEAKNKISIREKKHIESEMVKVDDLRKRLEESEKKYIEEKCRADCSSHELEISRQKNKKLEEELRCLEHSRKSVDNSTVPDVNVSTILLHEQLKLEKKRLKHAKRVLKIEKNYNEVLRSELVKLKQGCMRTVQHLDFLEKTFCGGTQAADKSIKSNDLAKLQSLYLNNMLFGSRLFKSLEDGIVAPGSSARCASGSTIPSVVCSQPDNSTESPSGITNKLHPGVREISPFSAVDSSAASFPDRRLVGSQEQVAVSLANPHPQATFSKHPDQVGKKKCSADISTIVDTSNQNLRDNLCGNSKKRNLLHEFESLKYMQVEGRRLHEELEEKMSKMHSKLNRFMPGEVKDANFWLPDSVASQRDASRKKRKVSHKLDETLDHPPYLANHIKRDKLLGHTPLPSIKDGGIAQAGCDHISDKDTLLVFEQQIQGNVMKLLELDDEVDEELFRTAIENPLTPTLPTLNFENKDPPGCVVDEGYHQNLLICNDNVIFGAHDAEMNSMSNSYDPGSFSTKLGVYSHVDSERNKRNGICVGIEQDGGTKISSEPDFVSDCAKQTKRSELRNNDETIPLFCILFSCMVDIKRISIMLVATRSCLKRGSLHSETDAILMEMLTALASEQQLTPREKVCIFFSLTVHSFLQVLSNESEGYIKQGSSCSFAVHLRSVLLDVKKRSILAECFCYSEFLCLFEDFVSQRRMVLCGDKDTKSNESEGNKVVLSEKIASTHEMFAGSVIFSSICLAAGQINFLCDVSFNICRMWPADPQLILYILHGFAFICGEKYLCTSNYSIQMEVIKSMVNFMENAGEAQGATHSQSDRKASHQFPVCARCPFAKSLQPLDILSMLVEELGKYACMPLEVVGLSCGLSEPDYASNKDINGYIDIMSSVELISVIMGWSWTTNKILPELRKLLLLSVRGDFTNSLVLLLGRMGMFGVKSCGYEDAGVESIKQCLSSFLRNISLGQNCVFASALYSAVDGMNQEKLKLDCPNGLSSTASSIFKPKCC